MNILRNRIHFSKSPHRRGFFIASALLYLITLIPLHAENRVPKLLTCTTRDPQGHTIPYVSVIVKPANIWLLSNEEGQFELDRELLNNDSLQVRRIGFQERAIALSQVVQDRFVVLKPDVLQGESVSVFARADADLGSQSLTHFSKTTAQGLLDHQQILQRIPGISIRSYGGPAGISTMSMDGGPSSQTKILVDGIDITSAQNGETDLSQLPLPYIESMSYHAFDITKAGNGSIDGQIRLSSEKSKSHLSLSSGSYGHQAYDVGYAFGLGPVQAYLQLGQRHEKAEYPFSWSNHTGVRLNNGFDQDFVAFRAKTLLTQDLFLNLTGLESHQLRGVAGLVWSPDTLSHRKDMLRILGARLGWVHPNGSSHFTLSQRQSRENYINPYLALNSDHALHSSQIGVRDIRSVLPWIRVTSDLNWNRDEIQSSEADKHERDSWNASLTSELTTFKMLKIVPSVKWLRSADLYDRTFSDLQLILDLPWGPLRNISASSAQIFNYPSFNDLYWEPGGNPDLKPERTQVRTLQSNLDLHSWGQIMLQWQHKESENLIQWMPLLSYWQPSNVLEASRESRKMIYQVEVPDLDLSLYAHYSRIKTLDKSSGSRLRYAPSSTSALSLSWSPGNADLHLDQHFISDRISMYSWPEDITLESAELWSASLAWTWYLSHSEITLVLAGDNLSDVRYESIRGYPEPGRTYRVTVNYGF